MGAIETAIQAIQANGALSVAQRRTQIQQTRANAINAVVAGHLPFTWTQGVWAVTVSAATVGATPFGYAISLTIAVTKSGVAQPLNNPLIFVNPPTLVDDPAGTITRTATLPSFAGGGTITRTLREDAVTALKQAVLSTLVGQLGP